jgi:hypothetical protein
MKTVRWFVILFVSVFVVGVMFDTAMAAKKKKRVKLGKNTNAAQERRLLVKVRDKIIGQLHAIENRTQILRNYVNNRHSKYTPPLDELESMALNIKSDIERVREDISYRASDGEISVQDRNTYLNRLSQVEKGVNRMPL